MLVFSVFASEGQVFFCPVPPACVQFVKGYNVFYFFALDFVPMAAFQKLQKTLVAVDDFSLGVFYDDPIIYVVNGPRNHVRYIDTEKVVFFDKIIGDQDLGQGQDAPDGGQVWPIVHGADDGGWYHYICVGNQALGDEGHQKDKEVGLSFSFDVLFDQVEVEKDKYQGQGVAGDNQYNHQV